MSREFRECLKDRHRELAEEESRIMRYVAHKKNISPEEMEECKKEVIRLDELQEWLRNRMSFDRREEDCERTHIEMEPEYKLRAITAIGP